MSPSARDGPVSTGSRVSTVSDQAGNSADDTTSELSEAPRGRRGRWGRLAGTALLVLIVLAAALDLLGPRQGETSQEQGGYTLAVAYPQIGRAGEPAPLNITVTSAAPFGETVRLRLCDAYFDHLDFQSWYPNPSAETTSEGWLVYEFDPPPTGDTLEISLDARVAPGQFGGRDTCEISVLEQQSPVVSVGFTTWRAP